MSVENNKLNSLRKVVVWLANQEQVLSAELKEILLPFDYFPSVLIDEINGLSLELFDELAIEEDNNVIIVHQEVLARILPNLSAIESFANMLDLELDERENNRSEQDKQNVENRINDSMRRVTQNSDTGDDVYEEALNYYLPYGKYPQNEKEALRLFKKAASLGCLDAYINIADIYTDGGVFGDSSGIKQNYQKAIEYYILGAKKGSIYCYYSMGLLYAIYMKDAINARKCFLLYAQKYQERGVNSNLEICDENINTIATHAIQAIYKILDESYKVSVAPIYHELIVEFSPVVREAVINGLEKAIDRTNGKKSIVAALKYFEKYLQENS